MIVEVDFNSDEALYIQLRNQIILAIAASLLHEGDALPPVRQMAGQIGINMHTVNKAYDVLRQEGFVTIDRRRGAVIAVDADRARALVQLKSSLQPVIARAVCQGVHPQEIHALVDQILDGWGISRRPAED